jgi:hypothetical protein
MVAERDVEVDHITITAWYRGARQRVPSTRPTWNWPATCWCRYQAIDRFSHVIDVHIAARPSRQRSASRD